MALISEVRSLITPKHVMSYGSQALMLLSTSRAEGRKRHKKYRDDI